MDTEEKEARADLRRWTRSYFERVSDAAGFYFALDVMPLVRQGCWGDPHGKYIIKDEMHLLCPELLKELKDKD